MMNIHYDVETGLIMAFGSATEADGAESHFEGCRVLLLEEAVQIDARTQRVDPIMRLLVAREPEPSDDRIADVKRVVAAELAATDRYMLPDFPVSDADRAAWQVYRKALRDASKGNATAAAMLAAIPARPDGSRLTLNLQNLG